MFELLKQFAPPYRRCIVVGPLCKLVEVVFDLLTPLVIARMIDQGIATHRVDLVIHFGCVLAVMALVGFGFTLVCQKMAARASQGMGTDMRDALFFHINTLSHAEIDQFGTPSLITRITSDVNQVQLAVALGIRQLVRFPLLAVGSMVAALLIDIKLGLIFLVATPLIGGIFWVVMARCIPFFKQMQQKLDRIALVTREGLSGARVVRAFVREDHERERFRIAADEQAGVAIAVGRLTSLLNPATLLIMDGAVCAILWAGGIQVDAGELTQGQVLAFVNYMTQTLLAIVYVANLVVVFTKASASAVRIREVLDCATSITSPSVQGRAEQEGASAVVGAERSDVDGALRGAVAACAGASGSGITAGATPAAFPALRMDKATFAFAGASGNALQDVSLELPIGGTLGVIGGTGSGKSTLVNLIPRLYDVTSGRVEVFGRDVRAWPLEQLRRAIGMVPQQAQLLSGTVRSNLQWRRADASDDELWHSLETAQAADFVRALPAGLDAPVESGGKNFSGGQRQRLTIARALVGNPQVLILDDSASALDFKTDAALRSAVEKLDLTTVIVSQRVSSVQDADLICVLHHGEVVGLGTHEHLLEDCAIYREIAVSQLGGSGASGATVSSQLAGRVDSTPSQLDGWTAPNASAEPQPDTSNTPVPSHLDDEGGVSGNA